ncbi:MAG: hypothetical protein Q4E09_03845 [Eubacteriales bacterium]|nr:hypothetical protein [Eubacteriales bacterium]
MEIRLDQDNPAIAVQEAYRDFHSVLDHQGANFIDVLKFQELNDLIKGDLFRTIFNYESEVAFNTNKDIEIEVKDFSREQDLVPLYLRVISSSNEINFVYRFVVRTYSSSNIESLHQLYIEKIREVLNY